MADTSISADYVADQLDAFNELKENGRLVQINGSVSSGPTYDKIYTPFSRSHYALQLELKQSDISGNVQSTDSAWMVEAVSGVVTNSMRLEADTEMVISEVRPLNFDGITDIFYKVFCSR